MRTQHRCHHLSASSSMHRVTSKFRESIRCDGYAFLPSFESQSSPREAISRIGRIEKVGRYCSVHELMPHDADGVKKTYSGTFGYGFFPLHTDFAHWFTPPRYIALRCVAGMPDVKTLLLDTLPIITRMGTRKLQSALVQPRNSVRGHRALLRILDQEEDGLIFRWDSVFVVPATENARVVFEAVTRQLRKATPVQIALADSGDTLVIDNWRTLHGRSAVGITHRRRKIQRIYLSALR